MAPGQRERILNYVQRNGSLAKSFSHIRLNKEKWPSGLSGRVIKQESKAPVKKERAGTLSRPALENSQNPLTGGAG
jgi:hypothetical protein